MTTAYEIFARAERLELAAATLYRRVMEMLPWGAEDRDILLRLEQEELQHAARVRLFGTHYRNDPRLFQLSALVLEHLDEVDAASQALSQEIEDGRWAGDLQGLKERIARMEEHSVASHAETLAECSSDGRVARFFRDLAQQDRGHRALLLGRGEPH
jgi:rubrerythrin